MKIPKKHFCSCSRFCYATAMNFLMSDTILSVLVVYSLVLALSAAMQAAGSEGLKLYLTIDK